MHRKVISVLQGHQCVCWGRGIHLVQAGIEVDLGFCCCYDDLVSPLASKFSEPTGIQGGYHFKKGFFSVVLFHSQCSPSLCLTTSLSPSSCSFPHGRWLLLFTWCCLPYWREEVGLSGVLTQPQSQACFLSLGWVGVGVAFSGILPPSPQHQEISNGLGPGQFPAPPPPPRAHSFISPPFPQLQSVFIGALERLWFMIISQQHKALVLSGGRCRGDFASFSSRSFSLLQACPH